MLRRIKSCVRVRLVFMSILINYGFHIFGLNDYTGVRFTAHYGAIAAGSPTAQREMEA